MGVIGSIMGPGEIAAATDEGGIALYAADETLHPRAVIKPAPDATSYQLEQLAQSYEVAARALRERADEVYMAEQEAAS